MIMIMGLWEAKERNSTERTEMVLNEKEGKDEENPGEERTRKGREQK